MNFAGIKDKDVQNGIGFGVSLFVSGCRGRCKGCFNPETWCFNYGEEFTSNTLEYIWSLLDRPYVDFFSILGGDPFEPENRDAVLDILIKTKEKYPNLKYYIWSRFLYEDCIKDEVLLRILNLCDVFVDGSFIESKKDLSLPLRGSSNQRVINLQATRKNGDIVLLDL